MRVVHSIVFLVVLAAILIFAVQNTDTLTLRFLNYRLDAPVSLVTVAVYLLGMISGWSFVGFLRRSLRTVTESGERR